MEKPNKDVSNPAENDAERVSEPEKLLPSDDGNGIPRTFVAAVDGSGPGGPDTGP